jgi:hypothetical protein
VCRAVFYATFCGAFADLALARAELKADSVMVERAPCSLGMVLPRLACSPRQPETPGMN